MSEIESKLANIIPDVKKLTQQDYEYIIAGIRQHNDVIKDLQRQNTDLQENNTKLVLENRELKDRIATLEKQLEGKIHDC